ncbi:uncharacterized protein [Periplaneta americana]|uniref:uncharacterized protein isoform X2 n=1 Tax=Periplaneta americana TaxID=6978 RepID=UPI0037E88987
MEQGRLKTVFGNLVKERNMLKEVIKQKKKEVLEQKRNLSLFDDEERTVNVAKCEKINQFFNKTAFSNEKVNATADGSIQCTADVQAGCVKYHISFIKKDLKDNEMLVTSLKANYYNPFHEAELKSWKNENVRKNNLQRLIRGTVEYEDWFIHREEITNLCERHASHFSVEKLPENGEYSITAFMKGEFTKHFSCKWKINWRDESLRMFPSFTFYNVENTNVISIHIWIEKTCKVYCCTEKYATLRFHL